MVAGKQLSGKSVSVVGEPEESIDPHELRQVLLGMRELMKQTRCQTLIRELCVAHDRISEIKIEDRSSVASPFPTAL